MKTIYSSAYTMKSTLHQFLISIFFAMAGATNAVATQEEKVLNIYNWSDYIADDTIANFEKETGIKVNYDVFDSVESMHSKLVAGRSGYDIVVSPSNWARLQADGGLLRPLNKSLLPNLKNLDPSLQKQIAKLDPDNKYMVTWLWGYTTVGINVDKVKAALGSMPMPDNAWDLLFKPQYVSKLKSCGVSFLDAPSEVVPAALRYLGRPLGSIQKADYDAALALLNSVRPYITLFSSTGFMGDMASGSVCVAMGWSGDLNRAKEQGITMKVKQHIQALLPKTGAVMFFDTMVIPADADHVSNAHRFMNYLMRPEVHASLTNKLFYANPNLAGRKFVTTSISNSAVVYPSTDEIMNMEVQTKMDPKLLRLTSRTFSKFKSGF